MSIANYILYYAESNYPSIETNAAATATDSMRLNDSYSQVVISHPLPVIWENSYAVISTRLEADNLIYLYYFTGVQRSSLVEGSAMGIDEATLLHMPQYYIEDVYIHFVVVTIYRAVFYSYTNAFAVCISIKEFGHPSSYIGQFSQDIPGSRNRNTQDC